MTISIAICDDDEPTCLNGKAACERIVPTLTDEKFQIDTFLDPVTMLEKLEDSIPYDLILCDVYMPGLLGTEAMKELRDNGAESHVIFLTSSVDHAVDAFALHADNYLVKPIEYAALVEALKDVIGKIVKERHDFIIVKATDSVCRLNFADVVYIETNGHYQVAHLKDGREISVRSSSQTFFDQLSVDGRFFKAGSSFILNLDALRTISNGDAEMVDGSVIPIPVRLRKDASDAFFERSFSVGF